MKSEDGEREDVDVESQDAESEEGEEDGEEDGEKEGCKIEFLCFACPASCLTIRAMLKTRISMALVLAAGSLATWSCDSGDTIVSVNYSFDDATASDAKMHVASLHIEIKPHSGNEVTTDVPIMHDADSGAITTASYKRVMVNGMSGPATVIVIARDSGGADLMKAAPADPALIGPDPLNPKDLEVDVVAHGAIAAFVKFAKPMPAPSDGGASDASGSGGNAAGSGGATGSGGSGSGGSGSGGTGSGGAGGGGSGGS